MELVSDYLESNKRVPPTPLLEGEWATFYKEYDIVSVQLVSFNLIRSRHDQPVYALGSPYPRHTYPGRTSLDLTLRLLFENYAEYSQFIYMDMHHPDTINHRMGTYDGLHLSGSRMDTNEIPGNIVVQLNYSCQDAIIRTNA